MTYSIESLVNEYGYKETKDFNGLKAKKGRQWFEVKEAALVPNDWNGDKRIIAKANVVSIRGTSESAYIYENLHVAII